jgi:hypothetical protein
MDRIARRICFRRIHRRGSPVGTGCRLLGTDYEREAPVTPKSLKRNPGKNDHPRVLQLVKAIADSGIARVQFRVPHDDFDVAIRSKLRYWLANGEINEVTMN